MAYCDSLHGCNGEFYTIGFLDILFITPLRWLARPQCEAGSGSVNFNLFGLLHGSLWFGVWAHHSLGTFGDRHAGITFPRSH